MTERERFRQQQEILTTRYFCAAVAKTVEDKAKVDHEAFDRLKAVSPAGLRECLIQRNNSDWVAAFLVQEIGDGGKRYLLIGDTWKISRARKSAKVILLDEKQPKLLFANLFSAQQKFLAEVARVLGKTKPEVKARKETKCQKQIKVSR